MNWMEKLKMVCEMTNQRVVSQELGVSQSALNQVLKGVYKGNVDRIQKRVEGMYMNLTVDCPVLGDIPADQCILHQSRMNNFAATNPTRVQLYKTCPTCPNRIGGNK